MLTPRIIPRRIQAVPPVRIKPFSLLNAHEERESEEDLELEKTLDILTFRISRRVLFISVYV